ncbi:MAG: DNA polymerase [Gemmataceae bacterium]
MRSCKTFHDDEAVLFDLETRSTADLKAVGGRAYARDPSTQILTLVAQIDGVNHGWVPSTLWPGAVLPRIEAVTVPKAYGDPGPVHVYVQADLPQPIAEAVRQDRVFVAHNCMNFDAHVWAAKIDPVPRRWYDTIYAARAAGLPGRLDAIGERLLGLGKDEGAAILKRVMRDNSKPPPLGYILPILRYNLCDVLLLKRLFEVTAGQDSEDAVLDVHEAINERGVHFDSELARRIYDLSRESIARATEEIERRTLGKLGADNIRSLKDVKDWLVAQGVRLPNLRRETVDRFLENPEDFVDDENGRPTVSPVVFTVLRLRQAAMRITGPKLERAMQAVDTDHRLRDLHTFHGAHTGRWTSQRVQIHNLPRGMAKLDVEELLANPLTYDAVQNALERCKQHHPHATPDDVLSALIRPTLRAAPGKMLLIVDYGAVECRGVGWVADEQRLLDVFQKNGDIYLDMAGMIFGRSVTKADALERNVGKVTVLGAGYGLSAARFGLYAANQGIDLTAAGVTAEECIEKFRTAYPRIAGYPAGTIDGKVMRRNGLWHHFNDAALGAVRERKVIESHRCLFGFEGGCLIIQLASGRELVYRQARVEDRVPAYCAFLGLPGKPKPTVVYHGPRGETTLYGGKITENVVQALCRDLLADALVRLEAAGLPVVLHVHDEAVCEVPAAQAEEALHRMAALMSTPPAWAAGFPVKVEGFACERYVKSAFKGCAEVKYLNGAKV